LVEVLLRRPGWPAKQQEPTVPEELQAWERRDPQVPEVWVHQQQERQAWEALARRAQEFWERPRSAPVLAAWAQRLPARPASELLAVRARLLMQAASA